MSEALDEPRSAPALELDDLDVVYRVRGRDRAGAPRRHA